MKFVMGVLSLLLVSVAHAESTVVYPSRKLGGYQIQIATLDPAKSWVSIQVLDRAGRSFTPGSIPLRAEYAARNIPFTPLLLEARGGEMVGQVSVPEGQPYTIRLQLKSGNTTFNPRFFINRSTNSGN